MTTLNAFWSSFDVADNTLEDHFSDFAQANELTTEEVTDLRTDIIETLIRYFAQMVREIHEAEQTEGTTVSSLAKIFDYLCDDCLGLEEDTKDLLDRSLAASAVEFEDDDDDDDADDDYKVKKFLKALVNITPGPDKDYIDFDQDTDSPDIYGNSFGRGVKVFDRRANRYGHGPNEEAKTIQINPKKPTKVVVHPRLLDVQNKVGTDGEDLTLGSTAAAATLHPNSMPSYSVGLSVAHHAVPGLMQYCEDNDICHASLGMGPGVQHIGFQGRDTRDKAARYLKQQYGLTSFKPFTRKTNESASKCVGASDLEESLAHKTDNHSRLIEEAVKFMRKAQRHPGSSYSDGAMASVRNQLQAQSKLNEDNPLFENNTSRDAKFLERLDKARN